MELDRLDKKKSLLQTTNCCSMGIWEVSGRVNSAHGLKTPYWSKSWHQSVAMQKLLELLTNPQARNHATFSEEVQLTWS